MSELNWEHLKDTPYFGKSEHKTNYIKWKPGMLLPRGWYLARIVSHQPEMSDKVGPYISVKCQVVKGVYKNWFAWKWLKLDAENLPDTVRDIGIIMDKPSFEIQSVYDLKDVSFAGREVRIKIFHGMNAKGEEYYGIERFS